MDRVHEAKNVDLTYCNRGVWLVKVPKYVGDAWGKLDNGAVGGKVEIVEEQGRNHIYLSLSDEAASTHSVDGGASMPKRLKFHVKEQPKAQHLQVMAERDSNYSLVGKVTHRAECQPVIDSSYMSLKRQAIRESSQVGRTVKRLDQTVQNYKPVSMHQFTRDFVKKQKQEGTRTRDEKDVVLQRLFAAFERHQYYNIKDLQNITSQPMGYLKEILNEICDYNTKNPHKNMWELKPQYRHYGAASSSDSSSANSGAVSSAGPSS